MNEVAGFEQRLQAMLFKANFAEKVDELRYVRVVLVRS